LAAHARDLAILKRKRQLNAMAVTTGGP